MACEVLVKIINGLISTFFLIVSVAFIGYGVISTLALLIINSLDILKNEYTALSSCLLVVFGVLLFLFVILGCCAICTEKSCCIETYSIFLTLLAIAQIGLGVFCLVRFTSENTNLRRVVETDVVKMFTQYPNKPGPMDDLQNNMSCCGVHGYLDWYENKHAIPQSCCPQEFIGNCNDPNSSQVRFIEGCYNTSYAFILGTNKIIGWSLIAVGGIEILAAILGICMSCAFWRSRL